MSADTLPIQNELLALSDWFAALRRADWFSLIPAEEWRTLSALLSFPHRDGACAFTPEQAAYVLGTDEAEAERRIDALSRAEWRAAPLIALDRDAFGRICGAALAPLGLFDNALSPDSPGSADARAEATGPAPQSPAASDLARRLEQAGLYPDQVDRLLSAHSEERIRRQLDWLPLRHARVPAALLVRAIEGDWGPPKEEPPRSG
jgi:hypothetical protein